MIRELTQDADLIESLYMTPSMAPIFRGVLKKRLLLKLPTGSYIASNVGTAGVGPSVYGRVPTTEKREEFWRCLKQAGINGTLITLFNNEAAYRAHIKSYRKLSCAQG